MRKHTWKLMLAGVFVSCAIGVVMLRMARATPPSGVTNTLLAGPVVLDDIDVVSQSPQFGVMIKTRGPSDAYVRHLTIAPGGDTGWHSHPGPVFVLVTAGTVTMFHSDDLDSPNVFPAGTGFVEGPGDVHNAVNEGDTNVELVVLFLVPHGSPTRIDEPAPGDDSD